MRLDQVTVSILIAAISALIAFGVFAVHFYRFVWLRPRIAFTVHWRWVEPQVVKRIFSWRHRAVYRIVEGREAALVNSRYALGAWEGSSYLTGFTVGNVGRAPASSVQIRVQAPERSLVSIVKIDDAGLVQPPPEVTYMDKDGNQPRGREAFLSIPLLVPGERITVEAVYGSPSEKDLYPDAPIVLVRHSEGLAGGKWLRFNAMTIGSAADGIRQGESIAFRISLQNPSDRPIPFSEVRVRAFPPRLRMKK